MRSSSTRPAICHVEMAIAALQAGKHVYCEKPAGITPESINRLVKAVRASDRVFCIGQQMRSYVGLNRVVARLQRRHCRGHRHG